ncbi:Hypothetical predicted protein [Marmota monax]|uniref:Uncharacterized protein n=1 Tax=Marmota monax TaxID=9995 RepID=A0A5E4BY36_MARMO|nr:Hypothetical predicted protein [Marmota monax]
MEARVSREQEAGYYLKSHRILDLLNHLTSVLLFVRPAFCAARLPAETRGGPVPALRCLLLPSPFLPPRSLGHRVLLLPINSVVFSKHVQLGRPLGASR